MTNVDFVKDVAAEADVTQKVVKQVVVAAEKIIKERLTEGREFKAFDINFSVKEKPERRGYNPRERKFVVYPASKRLILKPAKNLKDLVKSQDVDL